MSTFLPDGYESLKNEKNYLQLSKMKDGDNRIRIVMKPIGGWIDWLDKKPVRFRPNQKPKKSQSADQPVKAFWACYVWDYSRNDLFILEITQATIQKSLTALGVDTDWGDFTGYDIKITKSGTGMETRYSLMPLPHKPLSDEIKQALKDSPVRLEALYDGNDPWEDLDGESFVSNAPMPTVITEEQYENLISCIGHDEDAVRRTCERLDIQSLRMIPVEKYPAIYNWALGKKNSMDIEGQYAC